MTPMPRPDRSHAIVCYVTDRRALGASDDEAARAALLKKVRGAGDAGVDWVQIRERDLEGRVLMALVRATLENSGGSRILVNDRLDVAIAGGAGGVHLGGESLPVAEVVKWCCAGHAPADFLVGRSCHALQEALAAEGDGAGCVFFGPVFATPSKAGYGTPQGVGKLKEVCGRVRIPVLAIGGITVENATECYRAGAAGIAAIRMFQEMGDVGEIVRRLKAAV